jgi:hypothetical protein
MMKRLLAMVLALCLLASCGSTSSESSSNPDGLPMDFTVKEQKDITFSFENLEDSIYTMLYEPVSGATVQASLGLCIPQGYESDWVSDTDTTSDYIIYLDDTKDVYATVSVQTAPSDPKAYYGVETDEDVLHEMQSNYFTTENLHTGLRKNIVDDFGYELVVDWLGTAYGVPVSYLEFINPDSNTHSMRFYLCNDNLSENFYAFSVHADVPADDEDAIRTMRGILFSLHILDAATEANIQDTPIVVD